MTITKTLPSKTQKEQDETENYIALKLAQLAKNYDTTLNSPDFSRLITQDENRNLLHTYYYKIFEPEQKIMMKATYNIKTHEITLEYSK
jgi:hypothetical protein